MAELSFSGIGEAPKSVYPILRGMNEAVDAGVSFGDLMGALVGLTAATLVEMYADQPKALEEAIKDLPKMVEDTIDAIRSVDYGEDFPPRDEAEGTPAREGLAVDAVGAEVAPPGVQAQAAEG